MLGDPASGNLGADPSGIPGQQIVLKANPNWWGGTPRYQTVTFKTITDPNVRLQALKANEVDFIDSVSTDSATQTPKTYTAPGNVCLLRPNATIAPFRVMPRMSP